MWITSVSSGHSEIAEAHYSFPSRFPVNLVSRPISQRRTTMCRSITPKSRQRGGGKETIWSSRDGRCYCWWRKIMPMLRMKTWVEEMRWETERRVSYCCCRSCRCSSSSSSSSRKGPSLHRSTISMLSNSMYSTIHSVLCLTHASVYSFQSYTN